MVKKILIQMHDQAKRANDGKIIKMLESDPAAALLDLGCDDGAWTVSLAKRIGTEKIFGVEITESGISSSREKGIVAIGADLNKPFPYANDFFDVVHANQVIEHLSDTDNFVGEICRILKPGGYAVISTENLSSWHNVIALVFGWQPFSMSNFSAKGNIGNPFSLWKNADSMKTAVVSWQHNRLFSYYGLRDLFKKFNFKIEKIQTSGYYPFPGWLSRVDPVHGHYIAYKIRKKL